MPLLPPIFLCGRSRPFIRIYEVIYSLAPFPVSFPPPPNHKQLLSAAACLLIRLPLALSQVMAPPSSIADAGARRRQSRPRCQAAVRYATASSLPPPTAAPHRSRCWPQRPPAASASTAATPSCCVLLLLLTVLAHAAWALFIELDRRALVAAMRAGGLGPQTMTSRTLFWILFLWTHCPSPHFLHSLHITITTPDQQSKIQLPAE